VCQVYANRSHWKCFFLPNIHFLGPFEKWGVNLIRLLPMTKWGHQFIIATIDYLTMFVIVQSLKIELWNKHISWMNCGHWKIGSFSLCFVLLIHKEEKFYHVCFIHWRKLKHNVLHEHPFGITDIPEGDKRWWCFALCYCPQINSFSFSSSLQDPPLYTRPPSISIFWELGSYTLVVLLQHGILPPPTCPLLKD
jgi:hypothetical protein